MAYQRRKDGVRAVRSDERLLRVLAIDGGGMRGLVPAQVLAYLEERSGKRIHELFDLVAGTSTGGILALALTVPRPGGTEPLRAAEASDIYREDGRHIFARSPLYTVFGSGFGWWGPKYPADGVEGALRRRFGDRCIGDTLTRALVPSYDTEASSPYFFKSWNTQLPADDPYVQSNFLSWQAARATSAAPTCFPPYRLEPLAPGKEKPRTLVDGGVFANNPEVCGVAEALRLAAGDRTTRVLLVSVGTGEFFHPDRWRTLRRAGRIGWIRPLLRILMDGVSDAAVYQCDQILGDDAHRFQAEGVVREMDDTTPEAIDEFVQAGKRIVRDRAAELDALYPVLAAAPRWEPRPERRALPQGYGL